jgi:hypothetical protein
VLVEEGESGTFTDPGFFDYVVVEGSSDGFNWLPLAPGYDSRAFPEWSFVYQAEGLGDESLYKSHIIDLLDTFDPGDRIFIRFRLFSDPFVNGWGWAIDNINIQDESVTGTEPHTESMFRIYPNPARDRIIIDVMGSKLDHILILDTQGRVVRYSKIKNSGPEIELDISDLKDGAYLMMAHSDSGYTSGRFVKK